MNIIINSISEVKEVVVAELYILGILINRIKDSDHSIYIYTDIGIIRISDHHNQKSFENCISSILVPIEREMTIKMINLLIR